MLVALPLGCMDDEQIYAKKKVRRQIVLEAIETAVWSCPFWL